MAGALHGVLASLKAAAASATDTFFRYVSLLLNTTSTNGAQNNTFLDGSTNAFSITRNGNTTQGTFSPFSQTGWSNFFDGNGDFLNPPLNTALNPGTGDFTFECWFYATAAVGNSSIFEGINNGLSITFNVGRIAIAHSNVAYLITDPSNFPLNQWVHIVAARSATTLSLFVNGTRVGTATNSTNFVSSTENRIGRDATTNYITGYLSNLRLVKGTAVYDPTLTTLTVPTAPLTAITNTSLLTCQSNRFIDNSSNNFAITSNGDVSVQAFSPFNPTAAWSASTNGGSGYFDGTGDQLNLSVSAISGVGSSNFSIECWVYAQRQTNTFVQGLVSYGIDGSTAGTSYLSFELTSAGNLSVAYAQAATATLTDSTLFPINQWVHAVVCRSGSTLSLFVNGSRVATATTSATVGSTGDTLAVGGQWFANASTRQLQGYISNARIVNGASAYDATQTTLTVPTAPLTAITNTSLLMNFTNAGIFDSASGNDLETVGNAQVSTAQAKWGTTSISCDGTGDYVVAPSTVRYGYGTGDFTIEFWLYLNTAAADQTLVSNLTSVSSTNPHIYLNGATGTIRYYTASADRITGSALSAGQWYHIAVSRASSNTRMFINGTQTGSTYADTNNYGATAPIGVGTYWSAGSPVGTSTLNGYIDDLRITNGIARYTSNFTAPTAAFPLN